MRIDADRESYPYVTAFGAQKASPPTNRLYPLIVGTSYEDLCVRFEAYEKIVRLTIGITIKTISHENLAWIPN